MGDLQIGEKVYGDDGKLHKILGIYPQGKKQICEITFSDGTKTKCSDEHLWTVIDNTNGKEITLTVNQIVENGIYKRKLDNGWTEKRYVLPKLQPLEYEKKETLISPYLMGCLLGDGCFSQCVGITSYDDELTDTILKELESNNYTLHRSNKEESKKDYYIVNRDYKSSLDKNIYWEEIKVLGLAKHRSDEKFMPDIYLFNSVDNRLALLQGLLDTDGECRKDGQINFGSTSKKLVEQVIWLVQSLGGLATNYKEITNNHYHYINKKLNKDEIRECKNVYSIGVKLPKCFNPVRLTRKLERLNPNRIEPKRRIVDIKYLGKEECQCIYIDSERR